MGQPTGVLRGLEQLTVATGPVGPVGPTGAQGSTGAAGAAGASFVDRGTWAPSTAYAANDVVTTGSAGSLIRWICATPHTSGSTFAAGSNWAQAGAQGAAGFAAMVWNGTAYAKASDGTTGRPSSAANPGGTIFYIGPNAPTDMVTNDLWFNASAT